jgi:hypothetical protein
MKRRHEIDNILRSIHPKDLSSAEKEQMFVVAEHMYETATGRTVYRSSVAQTGTATSSKRRISLYHKALVGTLIFGLTGATAYASNSAVPGDVLFLVDRAVESVQLGLVSGERDARLRVKIAEERLDEIDSIIARNVTASQEGTDDVASSSVVEEWHSRLSDDDVRRVGEGLSLALGMLDDVADEIDENDDEMRSVLEAFNTRAGAVAESQTSAKVRVRIEEEDDEDDKRVRVRVEERVVESNVVDEERTEKVRVEVKRGRVRMEYDREVENEDVWKDDDYPESEKEIEDSDEESEANDLFDAANESLENAASTVLTNPLIDDNDEEKEMSQTNESDEQKRGQDSFGGRGRD